MIINIRGTSGSGKTHLVRQFMESRSPQPILDERGKKIEAYELAGGWFVIGSYENVCGGCDNFSSVPPSFVGNTMDYVDFLVRRYAERGNVLFEGLIVSNVWGGIRSRPRWEELARDYPPAIFLFLDTSLELCFQRVLARSGGRKPKGWDEGKSSLQQKYGCAAQHYGIATAKGLDARWLHHDRALAELEEIVADDGILD